MRRVGEMQSVGKDAVTYEMKSIEELKKFFPYLYRKKMHHIEMVGVFNNFNCTLPSHYANMDALSTWQISCCANAIFNKEFLALTAQERP